MHGKSICPASGEASRNFYSWWKVKQQQAHDMVKVEQESEQGRCFLNTQISCELTRHQGEGAKPFMTDAPLIQTPAIRPHLEYWGWQFNVRFVGDIYPNHIMWEGKSLRSEWHTSVAIGLGSELGNHRGRWSSMPVAYRVWLDPRSGRIILSSSLLLQGWVSLMAVTSFRALPIVLVHSGLVRGSLKPLWQKSFFLVGILT